MTTSEIIDASWRRGTLTTRRETATDRPKSAIEGLEGGR